jgi:hypothetical protein
LICICLLVSVLTPHASNLILTIADSVSPAIHAGLGTASTGVIGCALIIFVVIIAQVAFWAVVAYRCSEERLGLYAQV